MTYGEMYKLLNDGKSVILKNSYGNTVTYYLDTNGKVLQRFNQCKASHVLGKVDLNDNREINKLCEVIVMSNITP